MTDEEFIEIQRSYYNRASDPEAQARAAKSLQNCLESINAFKVISGLKRITAATADDCAAFQTKAVELPKSTLRPYPNSNPDPGCYSLNTVLKWSTALQAAWERACRAAGKKCVRGVVDEAKLLTENPWKQFTWIKGRAKPIRQLDGAELTDLLDYLEENWTGVRTALLLTKVLLWSGGRRAEITSLKWSQVRQTAQECHFSVKGKWGVERWFRIPNRLFEDLKQNGTVSESVFAAYPQELKKFYRNARRVSEQFDPVVFGDRFHERLSDWSGSSEKGNVSAHVFRKTTLQFARRGEDVNARVAKDAGVSTSVLMTHYVEERAPELREASNRTFQRILGALSTQVASRYGQELQSNGLEKQLQEAIEKKDWDVVASLSARLSQQS